MKILNSQSIHEVDIATCEAQKISSIDLMERAAMQVSVELVSMFLPSQRFVIFAGPGNNGGDALAVARLLMEQGYRRVEVFLFNVTGKLSHDCDEERKRLIMVDGVDYTEVTREFTPPYLSSEDVVVDGLFGSGLKQPLQGGFVSLARYVNESHAFVVSIDLPSGLFGEWNANISRRDVMHADMTLAFQLPRLSFFFRENAPILGKWKLLDIDLDMKAVRAQQTEYRVIDAQNVKPLFKPRDPFSGKRDYGSALLFGGSYGMMGAAVLCAKAVLKSGGGLVTVHSAHCGMPIVQTAFPEAMFEPDRNEHYITDMKIHHNHQAVAVGPGLGTHDATIEALQDLLQHATMPMVLDADALNCISIRPALLTYVPAKTILTPHVGEFDRMFGEHHDDEARLRTAIEMSRQYNIIIVLKGHYTAVVSPTGRVNFNMTGNAGMATAGAGDVLTGIITSFLSQGYEPIYAAMLGVYVHGRAGDMAEAEFGQYGMTASDIIGKVGPAIREILES